MKIWTVEHPLNQKHRILVCILFEFSKKELKRAVDWKKGLFVYQWMETRPAPPTLVTHIGLFWYMDTVVVGLQMWINKYLPLYYLIYHIFYTWFDLSYFISRFIDILTHLWDRSDVHRIWIKKVFSKVWC